MRLDHTLALRQEQRQILAPRMLMSMEVLQLPMMALAQHVEQALAENPALEVVETEDEYDDTERNAERNGEDRQNEYESSDGLQDGVAEGQSLTEVEDGQLNTEPMLEAAPGDEPELVINGESQQAEDFDRLDGFSESLENVYEAADVRESYGDDGERDRKTEMMANAPNRAISLVDDLREQFGLLEAPRAICQAGRIAIDHIDERGFLSTPIEELAATHAGDGLSLDHFIDALLLIQNLDPPGVGARDIRECLLIQLERLDSSLDPEGLRPVAARLVADYFDELQRNHLPAIQKRSGLAMDRIHEAIRFIGKHCDPSPGSSVEGAPNPVVVPDIVLEYDESTDDYTVTLTDTYLPSLTISRYCREQLESGSLDKQTRDFLLKKVRDARWLIDAIEQRRDTLRRVVREVVRVQREFIDHGQRFLKPLPMQDVAGKLGIHVSTVSRAVADKYVQCPRGIFRLRDCFSGGTQTDAGESVSYDAIREKVKEIIDNEDKKDPLSDDAVVDILKEKGINLARRTVAKYRSELDIPTARRRKQF